MVAEQWIVFGQKSDNSVSASDADEAAGLGVPIRSSDRRIRDDQSEWDLKTGGGAVLVAVTNYKGVLDDTYLGQLFGADAGAGNDGPGITYTSGIYDEPPIAGINAGQQRLP